MHGRRFLQLGFAVTALFLGVHPVFAQNGNGKGNAGCPGNIKNNPNCPPAQMRSTTQAQRRAARLNAAPQKKGVRYKFAGINPATAAYSPLALATTTVAPKNSAPNQAAAFSPMAVGPTALATMALPNSMPDYFGVPNWANSPLPKIDPVLGTLIPGSGMRKFVDTLPPLCGGPFPTGTNNLGQCIPVAIPDQTTFPGSDYYEISLVEYCRANAHRPARSERRDRRH